MAIPFPNINMEDRIQHAFAISCCQEINKILASCQYIFFKGPIWAEALYERPWMQKSADIDILVRPEDANLVLQRFRDAGYVYNGGKTIGEEDFCLNYQSGHPDMTLWHGHAESLVDSDKTRKPVEVHVTPFKISNSISFSLHSKTTAELISRQRYIKIRETIFPVLGHTDELIALVHHFAKHIPR